MAEGKRSEWAKKCHSVLKVSSAARRAVACKDMDVPFVMCRAACPLRCWRGGSAALKAKVDLCLPTQQTLKQHKHGWIFAEPVDPIKLQIPDYHQIIKKPMDLGTVKVSGCLFSNMSQQPT